MQISISHSAHLFRCDSISTIRVSWSHTDIGMISEIHLPCHTHILEWFLKYDFYLYYYVTYTYWNGFWNSAFVTTTMSHTHTGMIFEIWLLFILLCHIHILEWFLKFSFCNLLLCHIHIVEWFLKFSFCNLLLCHIHIVEWFLKFSFCKYYNVTDIYWNDFWNSSSMSHSYTGMIFRCDSISTRHHHRSQTFTRNAF